MLISFLHFSKHHLSPSGLFFLVSLVLLASPVFAATCNSNPVFSFSRSLYLDQYPAAREWLKQIEHERSPEIARFLGEVLKFKRAYENSDTAEQQVALDAVDDLISTSRRRLRDSTRGTLSLANMTIHAARMELAAEHVVRAARLARQGKRLLDRVAEQDPGNVDALLANGLYQYYTGADNPTLGRLMRWWSLQGDKVYGRELIERAVGRSPGHAFEAARSLMSDVAWNRQQTCRYLPLFEHLGQLQAGAINAMQEKIAAQLFCGRIQEAGVGIAGLEDLSAQAGQPVTAGQNDWIYAARVYSLAAQGDVDELRALLDSLKPVDGSRYHQTLFSLARALDVSGNRKQAIKLYRAVQNDSVDDVYRKLAGKYLSHAYKKPEPFVERAGTRLKFACAEE